MASPFLVGGLGSSIAGGLEQASQSKLQLAMMSAKLQAEQATHLGTEQAMLPIEAQKLKQSLALKAVDPKVTGTMAQMFGADPETVGKISGLPPQQPEVVDSMMRGLGMMQSRKMMVNRPKTSWQDINGQKTLVVTDPMGNVMNTKSFGPGSKEEMEARKITSNFDGADSILGNMRNQITGPSGVLYAQSTLDLLKQYPDLKINELTKRDPQAAVAFDFIKAHAPAFAVALRGTARVTENEINNLMGSLPNEADTVASATRKLDNLQNLFDTLKQSKVNAFLSATPFSTNTHTHDPNSTDIDQGLSAAWDASNQRRQAVKKKLTPPKPAQGK